MPRRNPLTRELYTLLDDADGVGRQLGALDIENADGATEEENDRIRRAIDDLQDVLHRILMARSAAEYLAMDEAPF